MHEPRNRILKLFKLVLLTELDNPIKNIKNVSKYGSVRPLYYILIFSKLGMVPNLLNVRVDSRNVNLRILQQNSNNLWRILPILRPPK